MARETNEIRREIAGTRQEIDTHLEELSGEVRREFDIRRQARQNMPQLLAGMAIAGLFTGVLVGHGGGRRLSRGLAREEARLARERRHLAKARGRLGGGITLAEIEQQEAGIP